MIREFGQECRRCGRTVRPTFDPESAAKTLGKLTQRLKKVFYGIEDEKQPETDVHSNARLRNFPHNSARCEACRCGVCFYDSNRVTFSGHKQQLLDRLEGPQIKIPWVLRVYYKRRLLRQKLIRPEPLGEAVRTLQTNSSETQEESHQPPVINSSMQEPSETADEPDVQEEEQTAQESTNDSSTDAEKLLASALAKLGIDLTKEPLDESQDLNQNVDLSYYNYYY